ncbi:PE family protein [Mycobacterium uberis]|uniref:PE family protein n=1 Tax=Mycobacterium uberis TaxID=2162698 RepID=UPI000E30AA63|nr:PE family protein [Mycobacterium uberis]
MSFVLATPGILEVAAAEVARIGSAVMAGNLAAVAPTIELLVASGDELSAATAVLFGILGLV